MSIKKIWKNRAQILEGIKNSVFKQEHIELIAAERQSICDKCDLIDLKGDKCLVPGTKPCCGECGCSLDFKTRSLSSHCPHPKGPRWDAYLTEEEEDRLNTQLGI
jgi:hypothetical protein